MTPRAARLLELFKLWTRKGNVIRPTRAWMAKWLDCSVRTVQTVLNELYRAGVLGVEHRYRRSSVFRVLIDAGKAASAAVCTVLCTAVEKPYNRRLERIESFSPLVIFREVYRRFARSAKPKKPVYEGDDEGLRGFYGLPRLGSTR
jgi:predicted transcriptional regulator